MVVRERYCGISFLIEDRQGDMAALPVEGSQSAREPTRVVGKRLNNL
jgi:hypothetical protein